MMWYLFEMPIKAIIKIHVRLLFEFFQRRRLTFIFIEISTQRAYARSAKRNDVRCERDRPKNRTIDNLWLLSDGVNRAHRRKFVHTHLIAFNDFELLPMPNNCQIKCEILSNGFAMHFITNRDANWIATELDPYSMHATCICVHFQATIRNESRSDILNAQSSYAS